MSTQTPWPTPLPYPYQDERQRRRLWRQVRADVVACLVVAAASVVLAFVVGALWRAVAPNVLGVISQGDAYLAAPESKTFVARDGWFAVFDCSAAVLLALGAYFRFRRSGSVGAIVGLVGGGFGAAYLAAWFGAEIGPGHGSIAGVVHGLKDGAGFALPLTVRATGVIWLWPAVAVGLYFILLLLFGPNDPQPGPEPQAGYQPQFYPFQGQAPQGPQSGGVPAWGGLNAVNGTSCQPHPQPQPLNGTPLAPPQPQPTQDLPPLPGPGDEPEQTSRPQQPEQSQQPNPSQQQTPPDDPPAASSDS